MGEVRSGVRSGVGSGNVSSKVPVKESKEMQRSTAAVPGGAPAKANGRGNVFPSKSV